MLVTALQKVGNALRHLVPLLSCIVFIFMGSLVWPIPFMSSLAPSFGLAAIYYWAMHRPDLLRPFPVFLLGLLNDSLSYLPLGLSAFLYIGLYQLSYSQRRFFVGQYFPMLWSGFALVALLYEVGSWVFFSIMGERVMTISPIFIQLLMTIVLFPLPAWVLNKLQKAFLTGS